MKQKNTKSKDNPLIIYIDYAKKQMQLEKWVQQVSDLAYNY